MPSSPADFDAHRRLVTLWTSASETEAVGSESDDRKALKFAQAGVVENT